MTHLRRSIRFSDVLAGGLLTAAAASASGDDVRRLLIDASLDDQIVMLAGLQGGDLLVSDERGQVLSLDGRQFVGFIAEHPMYRLGLGVGVLELIDGQRLVGELMPGDGDDAIVWWDHASLGALRVPLESVADIVLDDSLIAPDPGEIVEDVVVLANGDRITGFVERIGAQVVVDDGESLREVAIDGVGAIVLANPIRGMDGAYVWLSDESVVSIRHAQTTDDGLVQITASLGQTEDETIAQNGVGLVSAADILAFVFDAGRLVGLGRFEPAGYERDQSRRWSESPRVGRASRSLLGASPIELPGPMSVWWELPEGTRRLAFIAELPTPMRTWGDCVLIVEEQSQGAWRELVRERLNGERPIVRVNTPLEGDMLRITLDEGQYGPIQDRVRIERALLLVED